MVLESEMVYPTDENEGSGEDPIRFTPNNPGWNFQMDDDDDGSISMMLSPSIPPFGNEHENIYLDTNMPVETATLVDSDSYRIFGLFGNEQGHTSESPQLIQGPGSFNLEHRSSSVPHSIPSPVLLPQRPFPEACHHSSLSVPIPVQRPFEICGVSVTMEETSQLLRERLEMMEQALEGLDDSRGEAYRIALGKNAFYVKDEALRIPFLRADRFDPQAAAERFACHLSLKMELFGADLLVQNITQANVDVQALQQGHIQMLPERDRSGRVVLLHMEYPSDLFVPKTFIKALFYVMLVAARDTESQRNGCVMISFLAHKGRTVEDNLLMIHPHNTAATRVLQSMPLRVDSLHLCTDDIDWRGSSMFHLSAGASRNPWNIHEHVGSYQECLSQLPPFGILTSNFPVYAEYEVDTAFHSSVLEKLRLFELHQERKPQSHKEAGLSIVIIPGQLDVLCGRGRRYYEYMGNVRLRCKIAERAEEYDQSNKTGRSRINKDVVDWAMKRGQFLDDTPMGWSVVSTKVARKKVAHMFRDDRSVRVVRANAGTKGRPV